MQLAFVSLDAYPLLDPSVREGIGGAEVRAVTFARGLRDHHQAPITFVVHDRPERQSSAEGFRLVGYRKPKPNAVVKIGRSIAKRITQRPQLDPFYRDLEAEMVLCFGVRNDTASIVRSAQASGKRCVVFLTSDRNIEDALRRGRHDRGAYGELGHLCRFVLQQADLVVAQSPYQRDMLQQKLHIQGCLIRNPIDLTMPTMEGSRASTPTVLWVGRADTFSKRADVCIELAKRCPDYRFWMVMNNHDPRTFAQLTALTPPNTEIVEQVPFGKIEELFHQSDLLVNTSAAEGFPNSFLQAAKYGKPIVSLDVDPGDMLSQHGCGVVAQGDLDQMAAAVNALMKHRQRYEQLSRNAIHYVHTYHDATARCAQLHSALVELQQSRSRSIA